MHLGVMAGPETIAVENHYTSLLSTEINMNDKKKVKNDNNKNKLTEQS